MIFSGKRFRILQLGPLPQALLPVWQNQAKASEAPENNTTTRMVRRKPVSLIFRNATMPGTEPANSAGRLVDHDLGRKAGAFQQKVGCRVRHGPHACQSYGSGDGGLVSVMHIASSSDAANAAGPVVGLACERSSMMLLTRWRTRARAAAMASGRMLGVLECPAAGGRGCYLCGHFDCFLFHC